MYSKARRLRYTPGGGDALLAFLKERNARSASKMHGAVAWRFRGRGKR